MEEVNERSSARIVINFKANGQTIVPDSCNYILHDLKSGEVIKTDTIIPTSSTVTLEFSPEDNRIIDATYPFEVRSVTVTIIYNGTDQGTGQYFYSVKNLHYIVNP